MVLLKKRPATSFSRSQSPVHKGGLAMVVHIKHVEARQNCRATRDNFTDLLVLSVYFQVDVKGGDFNAFATATSTLEASNRPGPCIKLHDISLAVMLSGFDERINGFNAKCWSGFAQHVHFIFRTHVFMTYHQENMIKHKEIRDEVLNDMGEASDEAITRTHIKFRSSTRNILMLLVYCTLTERIPKTFPKKAEGEHYKGNKKNYSKETDLTNKGALRHLFGCEPECDPTMTSKCTAGDDELDIATLDGAISDFDNMFGS